MSFCVVYICEQLLSLYAIVSRSFGVLYNSPSCSSCFTGLHPNQSKLHSLKMLNETGLHPNQSKLHSLKMLKLL